LRSTAIRLEEELANTMARLAKIESELNAKGDAGLPEQKTVALEKLEQAETYNRSVRRASVWRDQQKKVKSLELLVSQHADAIAAIDTNKQITLAQAIFPVQGLGFTDDGVTFHDTPLNDCSSSQKLRVGIAIAMALNPEFRVIRVADAVLLDDENKAILKQVAEENDFQVWLEVVSSDESVGIFIEDGEVKSDSTKGDRVPVPPVPVAG